MFKTFNTFVILLVYFVSVYMFVGINGQFISWVLFEFNTLAFLLLCNLYIEEYDVIIYYFLLQSLGSFVFYLSLIYGDNTFTYFLKYSAMLLKMGVFPFHFWVYKFSSSVHPLIFSYLLTLQKIPPMLVIFMMYSDGLAAICIVCMAIGSIFIYFSKNLKELIISSSIYMTYWNLLGHIHSIPLFIILYSGYTFIICYLILHITYKDPKEYKRITWAVFLRFFIGIPPFRIFFMKWLSLVLVIPTMRNWNVIFIWLFVFITLIGYIRYIAKNFSKGLKGPYFTTENARIFFMFCLIFICFIGIYLIL